MEGNVIKKEYKVQNSEEIRSIVKSIITNARLSQSEVNFSDPNRDRLLFKKVIDEIKNKLHYTGTFSRLIDRDEKREILGITIDHPTLQNVKLNIIQEFPIK